MTLDSSPSKQLDEGHGGHEPDAVSVRWMTSTGVGLLLLVLLSLSAVAFAFKAWVPAVSRATAENQPLLLRQSPGVEPNQAYDRLRIQAAEREQLAQYRWIDEKHTVAQIPIARAMQLLAERRLEVNWSESASVDSTNSTEEGRK